MFILPAGRPVQLLCHTGLNLVRDWRESLETLTQWVGLKDLF